jgi:hypothetical protein
MREVVVLRNENDRDRKSHDTPLGIFSLFSRVHFWFKLIFHFIWLLFRLSSTSPSLYRYNQFNGNLQSTFRSGCEWLWREIKTEEVFFAKLSYRQVHYLWSKVKGSDSFFRDSIHEDVVIRWETHVHTFLP